MGGPLGCQETGSSLLLGHPNQNRGSAAASGRGSASLPSESCLGEGRGLRDSPTLFLLSLCDSPRLRSRALGEGGRGQDMRSPARNATDTPQPSPNPRGRWVPGSVDRTPSVAFPWATVQQASTGVPGRVSGALGHEGNVVLRRISVRLLDLFPPAPGTKHNANAFFPMKPYADTWYPHQERRVQLRTQLSA